MSAFLAALGAPILSEAQQLATPVPQTATTPATVELDPLLNRPVTPTTASGAAAAPAKPGIMLNFQGASLTDVLNYLSEAAGFVIVQEAPVSGTVNVVSRQPVSAEEAVELLNSVLNEKGYTALRNGRILKIVSKANAEKRELPVMEGSDPNNIPRIDRMVTQIMPVRYGEAAKLVENLRPLLAATATISANEGANSIILTDTQTNIHRIAQIIRAIDTSVSSISTIRIYPLQYANAKELATVITQLFVSNTTGGGRSGRGGGGGGGGRGGGGGGFPGAPGGGGGAGGAAQSEAREAASRVLAVADDQSNSLIVSAPEDLIPTITEMITKIDTNITDVSISRIFRLVNADAVETAEQITQLYGDTSTSAQARGQNQGGQSGRGGGGGQFGQAGGGFGGNRGGAQQQGATQSSRALLQAKVVAVGDPRTNSLLVSAARDTMTDVAEMIGRLDSSNAKKQNVYVHSLEHADADSVANVLRGMLGDTSATGAGQNAGSALTNRQANGIEMVVPETSSSGRGGGR